ncbi:mCG147366 [Mus musculus]|nr:mCG147366 [Mus musculus]
MHSMCKLHLTDLLKESYFKGKSDTQSKAETRQAGHSGVHW